MASKLESIARKLYSSEDTVEAQAKKVSRLLGVSWNTCFAWFIAKRAGYNSFEEYQDFLAKKADCKDWKERNERYRKIRALVENTRESEVEPPQRGVESLAIEELDSLRAMSRDSSFENKRILELIEKILPKLSSKERYTIKQRYMVKNPKTLSQIAKNIKYISAERARQIEEKALMRLYFGIRREIGEDTPGGLVLLSYWTSIKLKKSAQKYKIVT